MKILLVHNRYRSASPSGENQVVEREGAALKTAGHTVEQFEANSDDIAGWSLVERLLVPGRVVWSEKARRSLSRVLSSVRPDVAHIHNTFPLLSPSILYSCRTARIPVVATVHNYREICPAGTLFREGRACHDCVGRLPLPSVLHGCYRGSPIATLPKAVRVAVHSQTWRNLVSAHVFLSAAQRDQFKILGLPPQRVFVKANLVPQPETVAPAPQHRVAYVGRLNMAKGLPVLMAAWDEHVGSNPNSPLRLAIAGNGSLLAEMKSWAVLSRGVDVLGPLEPPAARRLIASSRAIVVPSAWEEPFGLVALEAMALGVPPIVSDRGALPEIVAHGRVGVVFRAGDVKGLAGLLRDVDVYPDRYRHLGTLARAEYAHTFDPARNLEQLLAIYSFAVANPIFANGSD
ncbi:MAG: glycosyltransferase [Chloroflexota bacterium]